MAGGVRSVFLKEKVDPSCYTVGWCLMTLHQSCEGWKGSGAEGTKSVLHPEL
ncbi:unnamed protein product [Chondrus crispus]|uniref:Uncharacterized protein n=1 Tax=Chondrus crispus TaxID=2769 RepID=R7QT38_CHOCR|nr:unnamed protein product [Chondrus crispus]CDF40888.1 unnamed protein product [Chondrus crispus]|eukprot:XP_005711182.1 unnamed protein product [Chondrus crispus]